MKMRNRGINVLVVLMGVLTVANLQAMKKRTIITSHNQPNNRPKIDNSEEEQTIKTQCGIISQGVQSNKINQEIFKQAIFKIATALKKLKEHKPTVCSNIKNVIQVFCKYLLESIVGVHEKQTKIEEIGIQLIGEERDEDVEQDEHDKEDRIEDNNNNHEPYFYGNYTNAVTIFDLLKKLFESLFDDLKMQETDELLSTVKQKRQELVQKRKENQQIHNQMRQHREELEKTIHEVHDLNEELTLQIENVQQDTQEKQHLTERYVSLNEKALLDKSQLKQLLNGEEISENDQEDN